MNAFSARTARVAVQGLLRGSGLVAVGTGAWVVAQGSAAVPGGSTVSPSTETSAVTALQACFLRGFVRA
ncbi:MAG: hypothetical protein V7646_7381 [Pseudonocardia sp.]